MTRSIHIYSDIKLVLDATLANPTSAARLDFTSSADARVWIHRANRFRVALRAASMDNRCEYDDLAFKLRGVAVIIELRALNARFTLDGKDIELTKPIFDLED